MSTRNVDEPPIAGNLVLSTLSVSGESSSLLLPPELLFPDGCNRKGISTGPYKELKGTYKVMMHGMLVEVAGHFGTWWRRNGHSDRVGDGVLGQGFACCQ